jgi:hypothetical protein
MYTRENNKRTRPLLQVERTPGVENMLLCHYKYLAVGKSLEKRRGILLFSISALFFP